MTNKEALPPPSSLKLYIKFAGREFPSGSFSWSCYRCSSLNTLTDKNHLEERVSLLEALLVTLVPQMQAVNALGRSNSHDVVNNLVSKIRQDVTQEASLSSEAPLNPVVATSEPTAIPDKSAATSSNQSPYLDALLSTPPVLPAAPNSAKSLAAAEKQMLQRQTPPSTSQSRKAGMQFKVHATPNSAASQPAQRALQQAYYAGDLKEVKSKFHFKKNTVDFYFPSLDEATTTTAAIKAVLKDFKIHDPVMLRSKSVRIAGLLNKYSPDKLFDEIVSHNLELQHIINSNNFRIKEVKAYKKNSEKFWAHATISDEVYHVITGKMKRMIKTAYLKLSAYDIKPLRCSNCQSLDGHLRNECKKEPVCAICAGPHTTDSCTGDETNPKCINCVSHGEHDSAHRADSPDCPLFIEALSKDSENAKNSARSNP